MQIVSSMTDDKLQSLLDELYFDDMIDFIEEMPSSVVKRVLENYKNENRSLINQFLSYEEDSAGSLMTIDDMIDFIEEMPSSVVKRVLENYKNENRSLINQFLSYEEDSAGSLMTIEYLSLKSHWTVRESLNYIRQKVKDLETIDVAYVRDKNRVLIGEISLKNLLLSKDEDIIEDVMNKNVLYVTTSTNQEEAIELFKKYDLTVLPVIDKEKILVGIITIDDMVDVIEEENTEDFQKMAAMAPSKEEYLESSVFELAKNRLTWLLVLMVSATFTGSIISKYEDIIEQMVVLAAAIPMLMDTGLAKNRLTWLLVLMVSATFTGSIISKYEDIIEQMVVLAAAIPMLMDTGGNAGSQSSTLVIRGMALGEIKLKDWFRVVWKELRVGIIVALGLGLTGGNAGSQSSTLVIRGMALGEIKLKDWFRVVWKELRVGIIVALGLGLVNFCRMRFILKQDMKISFLGEIKLKDWFRVVWKELRVGIIVALGLGLVNFCRMRFILKQDMKISFLVSFTLGIVVVMAKLVGGVLPLGAKKKLLPYEIYFKTRYENIIFSIFYFGTSCCYGKTCRWSSTTWS